MESRVITKYSHLDGEIKKQTLGTRYHERGIPEIWPDTWQTFLVVLILNPEKATFFNLHPT
jgi:hypothetical protein